MSERALPTGAPQVPTAGAAGRLVNALAFVLCLAGAFALFSPSVGTGTFINDAGSILRLPLAAHVRNVPAIFSRDFTFFTDGQYRPMGYAVLATLRTLVPVGATFFWHALLVALHGVNAFLVYGIAREFGRERVSVLFATGVFLAHPLASVFGNQMNVFPQTLAAACCLGGFLLYVRFVRRGGAWRYVLLLVLLGAGLLTSRILATLPLVLILFDALYERSRPLAIIGRCLAPAALAAAMIPVWVLMKPNPLFFIYPQAYAGVGWLSLASWVGGTPEVLLGLGGGWGVQAPLHEVVPALTRLWDPRFVLLAPVVLTVTAASVWLLLRRRWLGLGLLLIVLSQTPYASTAIHHVETWISWDTMYVAAAGYALCAGAVLDVLLKAVKTADARRVVTMMAALPICLYAVLLVVDNVQTRSPRDYWTAVLKMNRRSQHAWIELGKTFLAEDDADNALVCLFRPEVKFIPMSCVAMGEHYVRRGELLSAAVHMRYSVNAPSAGYAAHNETLGVLGDLSCALDALDYGEDFYARVLMRNPWHTPTMRKVARLLADKGYVRAAVRWAELACRLEPDVPENTELLASLIERRYVAEDPDAKDRVRLAAPPSPDCLRYAAAGPTSPPLRATLVRLADRHPADPVLQMAAGVCLVQNEDYPGAWKRLDNATRALRSFSYAWAAKCHVAMKLEKYDEAMVAGHTALGLDRRDPDVLHNLGVLYVHREEEMVRRGEMEKAREAFEIAAEFFSSALRYDARNADTHNRLAELLLRGGDLEGAASHWEQAIRFGLDNANTRGNLGYVLVCQGKVDEALRQLRTAMASSPGDASLHLKLARALSAAGRFDESILALSGAHDRFPDDMNITSELALLLASCPEAQLRNGPRAVALAEAAIARTPVPTPELLDVAASAYAESGRFETAVETASRALALAHARKQATLARGIEQRLELYRRQRPYRLPARLVPPR